MTKFIYDTLKKNKEKAMIDRQLFEASTYHIQLNCVHEEAMVIALER